MEKRKENDRHNLVSTLVVNGFNNQKGRDCQTG